MSRQRNNSFFDNDSLLYCSPSCSLSDSSLNISCAEFQLLQSLLAPSFPRLMPKDSAIFAQIREVATAMAAARGRPRGDGDGDAPDQNDFVLEEAMLCSVITNAVEVQDKAGRSLVIAVYDTSFLGSITVALPMLVTVLFSPRRTRRRFWTIQGGNGFHA